MFPINWLEILLISVPQTFLIIAIGYTLFNIKIKIQDSIIATTLIILMTYFLRRLPIPPGSHTLILAVSLTLIMAFLGKINITYSFIPIILGALILGIVENVLTPIILSLISRSVDDLIKNPVLNIEVFFPTLVLCTILFYLIKKQNFILYDLRARGNHSEE